MNDKSQSKFKFNGSPKTTNALLEDTPVTAPDGSNHQNFWTAAWDWVKKNPGQGTRKLPKLGK